jgi:hypothetical protein
MWLPHIHTFIMKKQKNKKFEKSIPHSTATHLAFISWWGAAFKVSPRLLEEKEKEKKLEQRKE